MVAAVSGLTTGARVRVVTKLSVPGNVSDIRARALINFPAVEGLITKTTARVATGGTTQESRITDLRARVLIRGHIDDPKIRVWTYTQDGHDFYVLRLGETATLVYDTLAGEWYTWASRDTEIWKAVTGINWLGGLSYAPVYGSNVITGDHTSGSLYFLDPEAEKDDHTLYGADDQQIFERVFQGQIAKRGYDNERCYAVELEGSRGEQTFEDLGGITMSFSDDRGHTYTDAGTISVPVDDFDGRITWRSLGSFTGPGRLFKFVDYGDLARIDYISVESDRE